jgi:hypothetical protein
MKRRMIRYTTKPDRADENERLIREVFQELRSKSPEGVRYLAVRLENGGFVHFVESEAADGASAITELPAFRAFQKNIAERCQDSPQANEATIIGNYRMLGE